jgi:hypothetical protein
MLKQLSAVVLGLLKVGSAPTSPQQGRTGYKYLHQVEKTQLQSDLGLGWKG